MGILNIKKNFFKIIKIHFFKKNLRSKKKKKKKEIFGRIKGLISKLDFKRKEIIIK